MLDLRDVIVQCKEIPVVERHLIASAIIGSEFETNISDIDENKSLVTIKDDKEFIMEIVYDKSNNNSKLTKINSLDKISPSIDFSKMREGFGLAKII